MDARNALKQRILRVGEVGITKEVIVGVLEEEQEQEIIENPQLLWYFHLCETNTDEEPSICIALSIVFSNP